MKNILMIILFSLVMSGCNKSVNESIGSNWEITVLPSSVRLDPVTNEIIESRFHGVEQKEVSKWNFLKENWIYDGEKVNLHGARGEYVSFQVVLTNLTKSVLKNIHFDVKPFKNGDDQFANNPELFLEWSVEVQNISTGYTKATLGTGWYPDALIPFK